jgi:hypothetical protein
VVFSLITSLNIACPSDPPPDPEEESTPAAVERELPTAAERPARAGAPLVVDLQMEGLAPLYKGFFSERTYVAALGTALAPHVASRSVTVKAIWVEETVTGSIQLLVPDGEAALARAGAGLLDDGDRLDIVPLAPYVAALDGYRTALGERYDLRIFSFGLALELWDPHSEYRCMWPTVDDPQTGPELGPLLTCRDPFGESYEIRREGDSWPAAIEGHKKARKALLGALGG